MALLTYDQARPWAKAIKQAVALRKMPPWFAAPGTSHFKNDRSLTPAEIATLGAWADAGAPRGNAKDAPKPLTFVQGWAIGKPDAVFEMPKPFEVKATGTVDYQWVVIPVGYPEDRWIRGIEVRPGNRKAVHHIAVYQRRAGSKWLAEIEPGTPTSKAPGASEGGQADSILGEYVPGLPPKPIPDGTAMLLTKGSDVVLQIHYTPTGKVETDQSKFGLLFASEPPRERYFTFGLANTRFVIPPGAPETKVDARATFGSEIRVIALQPHMHFRGKSFDFRAIYPDGRTETLLAVPRYDFNWQLSYEFAEPKILPPGTRLEATGLFDNSPNNPFNPDPKAEVRHGDQTSDEMMAGVVHMALPLNFDFRRLLQMPAPYQTKKSTGE